MSDQNLINQTIQRELPRVLFIDGDESSIRRYISALSRGCCQPPPPQTTRDGWVVYCHGHHSDNTTDPCCAGICSLDGLGRDDIGDFDLVICAMTLPDGTGFDALRVIHEKHPHLPVVLIGDDHDMADAAEAIRAGAIDVLHVREMRKNWLPQMIEKWLAQQEVRIEDYRTIRQIRRSFAMSQLQNQRLESLVSKLDLKTRTDELTRLFNRRWLNLALQGCWMDAARNNLPLAFLMIDLDGFKHHNDTRGHQDGDRMLQLAAKVIQANSRQVDIVARYGGDEFCVLMPHTTAAEAKTVAQRIIREFESSVRMSGDDSPNLSMSIGLAHIDLSRPINSEQLAVHADEAMYAAKSKGKGRVMIRRKDHIFAE